MKQKLILSLVLCVILAGCSGIASTSNGGTGTLAADILGKWKNSTGGIFTFNADGSFNLASEKGVVENSGTYRVADAQTVIMTVIKPDKTSHDLKLNISISGNQMTITRRDGRSDSFTKL